jgi:translation initiation factor IF-2
MTDTKPAARPPVVVVMGHIDHGKSTLLDFIRKSNVVAREAGGITQKIGAYEVKRGERSVTFLDTPGHAAFKSVRARGATAADVAILLVSAEDGVKPQTLEALAAIKAAGLPFVVAINKIDSPKADAQKTKQTLADAEVFVEGYGGDVAVAEISAKTGHGNDELLDLVLLTADIGELTGDPAATPSGFVIEATKDKQRGVAATLVLKNGTLRKGKFVAAAGAWAPIRRIDSAEGKALETALPSQPVQIIGWSDVPAGGTAFVGCDSRDEADAKSRELAAAESSASEEAATAAGVYVLPVVVKADLLGSADAIALEISKLATDRVRPIIVARDQGDISEADVKRATATPGTVVVGFNVKVDRQATTLAERDHVAVSTFTVIYDLVDYLAALAKERTPQEKIEVTKAEFSVVRVFNIDKGLQVIGGRVLSGELCVGQLVKLLRRGEEIGKGNVKGLQQQKLAATCVKEGNECGAAIECRLDIAEGDRLIAWTTEVR